MNLKDEKVIDSLMFTSDTLQALEEEHDPILAHEAGRVIDGLIRDLEGRGFPDPECEHSFQDDRGLWNCSYHDGSIGYCMKELCPLEREEKQG